MVAQEVVELFWRADHFVNDIWISVCPDRLADETARAFLRLVGILERIGDVFRGYILC